MRPTYNSKPLKTTRSLPKLKFGDVSIYLLDNPSLHKEQLHVTVTNISDQGG